LESWQPDPDEEGWRLSKKDKRNLNLLTENLEPPEHVDTVPRFSSDVRAIESLTDGDEPPKAQVRPNNNSKVAIIFGDASGSGYGTSLWKYGSKTVDTEYGMWTKLYGSKSSNYQELYNMVLRVESLVELKKLERGSE
jgi:hypothetical protein